MDKTNIAILTTVANFELYHKTAPLFPEGIQKYVIDGRQGMHGIHSILYMIKKLKGRGIKWLVMADEDVIFNASEAVFSIIQKMIDDNITVCGVRDGGDVKHRNYSPYVINTFFSIINLEEVLAIWNKKEMLNHQYIKENEFSEDLSQLKFDYDASSLYEPYYCFYFWLRRQGKRFLFLDTQMDSDDISNEVFFNNEKVLCHTWYARSYNTNKKHTERIDLHLKKNINTKAKAFSDDVIFFNDKLFGFNQKLAKLSRKVKMKLKG